MLQIDFLKISETKYYIYLSKGRENYSVVVGYNIHIMCSLWGDYYNRFSYVVTWIIPVKQNKNKKEHVPTGTFRWQSNFSPIHSMLGQAWILRIIINVYALHTSKSYIFVMATWNVCRDDVVSVTMICIELCGSMEKLRKKSKNSPHFTWVIMMHLIFVGLGIFKVIFCLFAIFKWHESTFHVVFLLWIQKLPEK